MSFTEEYKTADVSLNFFPQPSVIKMKVVSIVVPVLLVLMVQSSFALPKERKEDITAVIENVQELIRDVESMCDKMVVNAQTVGGPVFQLQLLLRDLILAIGRLSRSMARTCRCGELS